jgi:hypothetical protein
MRSDSSGPHFLSRTVHVKWLSLIFRIRTGMRQTRTSDAFMFSWLTEHCRNIPPTWPHPLLTNTETSVQNGILIKRKPALTGNCIRSSVDTPSLLSKGHRGLFSLGAKWTGREGDHSLHLVPRLRMRGGIHPIPHTSCCGKVKGKDKVVSVLFNRALRHEGVFGEWRYSSTHSWLGH